MTVDLTRQLGLTEQVKDEIRNVFQYQPWGPDQAARAERVMESLALAVTTIIDCVPPSPDRSAAIRKLREARSDCNSAITHNGKY